MALEEFLTAVTPQISHVALIAFRTSRLQLSVTTSSLKNTDVIYKRFKTRQGAFDQESDQDVGDLKDLINKAEETWEKLSLVSEGLRLLFISALIILAEAAAEFYEERSHIISSDVTELLVPAGLVALVSALIWYIPRQANLRLAKLMNDPKASLSTLDIDIGNADLQLDPVDDPLAAEVKLGHRWFLATRFLTWRTYTLILSVAVIAIYYVLLEFV